jgi:hypothetical protein
MIDNPCVAMSPDSESISVVPLWGKAPTLQQTPAKGKCAPRPMPDQRDAGGGYSGV